MTKVLIVSHDVVGDHMAGPGIRYWELARVLAADCDVTLAVPWQSALRADLFAVEVYEPGQWQTLRARAEAADVVVPCGFVLHQFPHLARLGCALVVDGYDPYPAETLGLMVGRPQEEREAYHRDLVEHLRRECLSGDFFLCASERQRYWWLGLLAAHGRLNTATYAADPTLRNLVDVVPFGCRPEPLQHTRPVLKGVAPGIGTGDSVILWGGGIWEWLDPLTLLRAVRQVVDRRPGVRLVFPGTRHPNQIVPDMPMQQRALDLARELDLLDRYAFFGDWVPYADWPNYLLEADVGASLHFDTLETQLAFRSRVLDYVRAGLPVIASRGDATSELVARYELGLVVDFGDVEGVAHALHTLLGEPRGARAEGFAAARAALSWERAAQPLVAFCRAPCRAADRQATSAPSSTGGEAALAAQVARLEAETERLGALVRGYEQGRFMRFMCRVQAWRNRLSGRDREP
jgi:glycosyltransferase involved in cell wall biosynthesis